MVVIPQRRLWTHIGLARELRRRPPNALFIPAHVLPLSQALMQTARRTTRSVVTLHDVGYRYFPRAHPLRQRLYLDASTALSARYASHVIVDSQATRRDIQRFYGTPDERITVAYPGLLPLPVVGPDDVRAVRARLGLSDAQPYALYVGTLQPRKNLRRLMRAWAQVVAVSEPQKPLLILAGAQGWGAESEHLRVEVQAHGLSDLVRFAGYVSDEEKAALLHGARVFAFPSLYEGFGFPVLEAQSAGVPVVCSNTSSLPEVAGEAALLVDPLDVNALAAALRQAMTDAALRQHLSGAGARNVAHFSWRRCAELILEQLQR
jgi:glycosyltransferase involved in cell wall biosynthesis